MTEPEKSLSLQLHSIARSLRSRLRNWEASGHAFSGPKLEDDFLALDLLADAIKMHYEHPSFAAGIKASALLESAPDPLLVAMAEAIHVLLLNNQGADGISHALADAIAKARR